MIVCVCLRVNDEKVRQVAKDWNCQNFNELKQCMKIGSVCGACREMGEAIVQEQLRVSVMEARGAHNPKDQFDSVTTQPE